MTWRQRIDTANLSGKFTDQDRVFAVRFETCAVEEAYPGHSTANGSHEDPTMNGLGYEFYYSVRDNDISEAERVYAAIYERAKELNAA